MADGSRTAEFFDSRQIAEAMRKHKRNIERRSLKEKWPFVDEAVQGGRKRLYRLVDLPSAVQAAVLLHFRPVAVKPETSTARAWTSDQLESAWERYSRATDAHKAIAERRQRALLAVEALTGQGFGLIEARKIVADQLQRETVRGGSVPSLGRWAAEVAGVRRDAWLPLLLPDYLGRTKTADIPAPAWDCFKADYLRLSAPSATSCYERLQRIAAQRGWQLPSCRTFERRIERELSRQVLVLAREGEEALMRTFPAQQRDRSIFNALEAVNADGHKFDVFVRFPNGEIGRAIMLAVQDLYSGKVLGWRLGDSESSDLVRLAFADVVRRYGIPAHTWLDNGRGFASKMITGGVANRYRFKVKAEDPTGILTGLGIAIHWATPYHGQAKPIERAFRDMCDRIAKHPAFEGAYTGNKPEAKPENYGSRAIAWDVFARVVNEEIAAHNAREGRRSQVCAGRSFDQAFNESYAKAPIRKATEAQLRQMLLAAESVLASRTDGSVSLLGNRYWDEALAAHAGQRMVIRFDPDHLHDTVAVFTLAGQFVADADCIAAVGFADTNAGREHARAKRQYRRGAKQQLDAERRMDAAELVAQLPTPPAEQLPEATVVQGHFRGRGAPRIEPERVRRTGTDDATPREAQLADHLKRMQEQQLRDALWQSGEEP